MCLLALFSTLNLSPLRLPAMSCASEAGHSDRQSTRRRAMANLGDTIEGMA